MNGEKKTAPGVASTESGKAEREALRGATFSKLYFSMRKGPVSSILLMGQQNALPGREIRRILGLKNVRDVSAQVEAERRKGVPICASCDSKNPGYYLPGTPEELAGYNASLCRRIKAVSVTLEALEAVLEKWRRGHE